MKINHTGFLAAFRRNAATLLEEQIPGKVHLARQDINTFLKKEKDKLRRWHYGLILNLITSEEFGKLFSGLRNSLFLKKLKQAGLSAEQLIELTQLLRKLFRAMMITHIQEEKS